MSGSVTFTYKRRRFSNKPQIIDESQFNPSSKSPIVTELQIEPHKEDKLQSEALIGDYLREVKKPQIELEKIEDSFPNSQINPNSIIEPIKETHIECNNKYRLKYKSRSKTKSKSAEINRTEIEMKILPEKEKEIERKSEIEVKNFPEKEKKTEIEMKNFPEKEKEFQEKERETEIEKIPEIESEMELKKIPEQEKETEIEVKFFPEKEIEEIEMKKIPEKEIEIKMRTEKEKDKETEIEMKKIPEMEKETELEWLNSLEKDLNEKKKESKDQNVKFHKNPKFSPDLLSLKPNFNQEISSSSTSQTKSKSSFLFGVSIKTLNTQNLKGKSVNSPTIITQDLFPSQKTDQSQASISKKLKFQNNNNYYFYGLNNNNIINNNNNIINNNNNWTEGELDSLWIGVRRYGTNNWYGMLNDPIFCFNKYKSCEDLAKRWEIEQKKLFSVPIPVSHTGFPYRYGMDLSLDDMSYTNHNNEYLSYYNNSYYSYNNDNISRAYLHNNYNNNNNRRAKYQTRRNKNNINSSININDNNNEGNNNNNNELPHWLREMIEVPAGGIKRKLNGNELNMDDIFCLNEKKPVRNSVPVQNLVVIDSDDDDIMAGSEETISE